jgi:hypothetical protein
VFTSRYIETGDVRLHALTGGHTAERSVVDVVQLVRGYKSLFMRMNPIDGEDADDKAMVVVFPDLSMERASDFFGELLEHLQVPVVCGRWALGATIRRSRRRSARPGAPRLGVARRASG